MASLQQGSRGQDVSNLQGQLKSLGYDVGSVDGIFGPKTTAAVRRYQQEKGLGIDGIAGPKTLGALNTPAAPSRTTSAQAPAQQKSSNTPLGLLEYTPMSPDEIRRQAEARLSPLYNSEVEGLNQEASRNRLAYEQQIGARNDLYNLQKQETNELANEQRQRSSDQSLKRGLARSSIAVNDLARVDTNEAKALQSLQRGLESDIGNIQSQITLLENQLSDSLRRLDIDRATRLQSEIDTLTQQQNDKQFQITQINNQYQRDTRDFAYQQQRDAIADQRYQQEWDWNKKMEEEKLALQRNNASRSSSGGLGSNTLKGVDAYTVAITDMERSTNPYKWFTQHDNELKEVFGERSSEYQDLKAKARAYNYSHPTAGGGGGNTTVGGSKSTLYAQYM